MADLRPIEYPSHLDHHNIPGHELARMTASMTPEQIELAKDWSVIRAKLDWIIRRYIEDRAVLVEHDRAVTIWNRVAWLGGILLVPGNLFALAKMIGWL